MNSSDPQKPLCPDCKSSKHVARLGSREGNDYFCAACTKNFTWGKPNSTLAMSERDPAAEAEKMLDALQAKHSPNWSDIAHVFRSDAIALLRELVERREGDRRPMSEMPEIVNARKAIRCLAYEVEPSIQRDVSEAIEQAFKALWRRPLPAPPAEER